MAKWDVEVSIELDEEFDEIEAETEDLAITEALKLCKEKHPNIDIDILYERHYLDVYAWEIENG
jgi:hypothetical protein